MARRFVIRTFGCQMNEHDSERLAGLLRAEGMQPAEQLSDADVVVLNTCCIRENADNKLYGHLGQLKAWRDAKPGAQIAVGGCLAQKDGGAMRERAPHVDVVFGTHNLARAPELLRRARLHGPLVDVDGAGLERDAVGEDAVEPARTDRDRAWVTIQTGCDNSCAFCVVPSVRGPEVSRPFADVVREVEHLARRGVTEVTLLGQNVNSYGRDLTRRRPLFAELLEAVGHVEGIRRVRFTSPHPKDLRPETISAMARTPAVCPQLHLPLQSGSDRVLKAMRRGYTAARYLERLHAARAGVAELAVTTDVIVGFPGETEEEFQDTLAVVAAAHYDSAYTFIFSPRRGTRAAEMTEHYVPSEVAAERFARLRVVVERSALERHQARIGRVEEVLVQGPSRRQPGVWTGRTPQGKLVHFTRSEEGPAGGGSAGGGSAGDGAAGDGRAGDRPPSDAEPVEAGAYADVTITGAGAHHLRGRLVRVTETPRRRTGLAVMAG